MAGSKFFSILVVGDNPEEQMAKYDCSLRVKPYIKYKYLDAEKMHKNAVKVLTEVVKNSDKFNFNKLQTDYFRDKLKSLSSMSSFEYYSTITHGLSYDDNGNAMCDVNPKGKWQKYNIGKHFSYPFKLKDGSESYQALVKDIDWDEMHMGRDKVRLFETLWDLVVNDSDPQDEEEATLKREWQGRQTYFKSFKDVDEYVAHNCAYWNYAFLSDKTGWVDIDDENKSNEWVAGFFDRFIEGLGENDKLTIFEYSRNDEEGF